MGKKRRTFTREFRIEAVKLVEEQRYSFAAAAESLGINESMLRRWKQKIDCDGENAFPERCKKAGLEAEINRLNVENKRLRMERDILKKAAAVLFAEESK